MQLAHVSNWDGRASRGDIYISDWERRIMSAVIMLLRMLVVFMAAVVAFLSALDSQSLVTLS